MGEVRPSDAAIVWNRFCFRKHIIYYISLSQFKNMFNFVEDLEFSGKMFYKELEQKALKFAAKTEVQFLRRNEDNEKRENWKWVTI